MRGLALLFLPALLTAQPDPRDLLHDSADAIKKYKTYQLESIVLIEMHGGVINTQMEMPSSISVRRPDHMRVESRSQAGQVTIVGDGAHTWYYMSPPKKYIRRAAVASPETSVSSASILPKNLPDVNKSVKSIKLTGEEILSIEGEDMPCWTIETVYDQIELPEQKITILEGSQISWIRKSDHLSLQNTFTATLNMPGVPEPVKMNQSTRTTAVRLNLEIPDSTFVFTPPAGSKETEDWTLPGIVKPDVIGKPAPNLKAKSTSGAAVDLAALKGKVVLLDFFTTWCQPCQRDLPILDKLQREFRAKGLVVIGVNVGEDRAAVEKFLAAKPLGFPGAPIDETAEIVSELAVATYPTVVLIDRKGNVATYSAGVRGEVALRAALQRLGIAAPVSPSVSPK